MALLKALLRWSLRLVVGVVVCLPLVLVLVYGLLRSGVLTGSLGTIITALAREEGVFFVRVEEVSGDGVPETLRVGKVEIGDYYGVWLTIEDAVATWEPFDLFHPFDANPWRIHISDVHAGRLLWTRLPRDGPDEPEEPTDWNKFLRLVVDHLVVDELELSGDILGGGRALLKGEGAILLGEWHHALLRLDLEHVDDVPGRARIDLTVGGSPVALEGSIEAEEGEGGALASLARLTDAGKVRLDVRATGPMADWHAEAEVTASRIGELQVQTDLAFRADGPFEVRGTFDPVAEQRRRYLVGDGKPMTLEAEGAWAPDVEVRLDRVQLLADGRELLASGHLDLASLVFDVRADLAHVNESETVVTTLVDVAAARLRGKGVLGDGGHLEASLELDAPTVAGVSGSRLRADLEAEDIRNDEKNAALPPSFRLKSHVEHLTLDGGPFPLLGDTASLTARGRIDLDAGSLVADEAAFEGGPVRVHGPFSLDDQWGSMKARFELNADDLGPLTPVLRTSVAGRVTAALGLAFSSDWRDFEASLSADSEEVAIGEAGWNALLGGSASLTLDAQGAVRGPFDGKASFTAAGITASAEGSMGEQGRDLEGNAKFVLDNLSRLAEPGWASVAGRLEAALRVGGSLDLFDLEASIRGDRFSWEGLRFDSLAADLQAEGLPDQWSGSIRGHGEYGDHEAHVRAKVAMPDRNHLVVEDLSLRGPETGVDAALDLVFPEHDITPLVSGTLKVRSDDLSLWRPMTGLAIGGQVKVDATLSARPPGPDLPRGMQTLTGKAIVRDAAIPGEESELFIDELDLVAEGLEIGDVPRGRATVTARRVRYAGSMLVEGQAEAFGDGAVWTLDMKLDVRDGLSLRLDAGATLRPGAVREVALKRAEGDLAEVPFRLVETVHARFGGNMVSDWSAAPVHLALGKVGRLRGRAAREKGRLRLEAEASSLPLRALTLFTPFLELGGSLDGSLEVAGSSQATLSGVLALRGHEVVGPGSVVSAGRGSGGASTRPVEFEADARFGDGRLAASAGLHGLDDTKFSLTLKAPLVAVAGASPFEARLLWKGEMADVLALAPFGDDTVRGRVDADLSVTGTLEAPRVVGRARVEEGRWSNAATGLVLHDLRADLSGSGTDLELIDLTATDGDKGRVRARGGVHFGTLPAFDAELEVEAVDAMLARLDVLTARADASIALRASRERAKGSPVSGTVSGSVQVDEARVEIPRHFTSDVPEIEVIEVGADPAAATAASSTPGALGLDVTITADDRVFVAGRGLESEWAADLRVAGNSRDPRLFGTVTSVRGDLSLLGRRFDLQSALLRFDGKKGNIPYLTMKAQAEANDITAVAVVTGPVLQPTIELRSNPPLPRDEVLSRLLFGQSTTSLSPMQSVELARSVAQLTGSPLGGDGGVLSGIGRTLGFDRFGVESSGKDGSAALTASKYLTDDVYLRVQGGLTPEDSKVSLEWQVFKHITIDSDVSQDAQGEVGVTWRWDY